MVENDPNGVRAEYDFTEGVRGKHCRAMHDGYTIIVHQPDGTKLVKEVIPNRGVVVLEPDVQAFFPDSESVNTTLRALIQLIPKERRAAAEDESSPPQSSFAG